MSKRGRERNIRERDGKFYFRYDVKDAVTGKRKQKESKGFATAPEARREAAKIQNELYTGTFVEEKNIMFVDWMDKWLAMYASTGKVKNSTVANRKAGLAHPKRIFKWHKLKDITKLQYQAMLEEMKTLGLAQQTISLAHIPCRMLFEKAVELELIKSSPAVGAYIPSFQKTVAELEADTGLPKYLEKEELAKLLKTAKESGDIQGYHTLFLLAYTGLRIGELCALKPSDFDEVEKTISVTKTLFKGITIPKFILNTPKTKSSVRKIDISKRVVEVLKEQMVWRKKFKMSKRKKYYNGEEFMFINDQRLPGYPIYPQRIQDFMREMLVKAELSESLTPHSLRHTYTSLMAEAGVELEAIQKLLGHRSNTITREVYLHVTKARKKAAVELLDNLLDGPVK